MPSTRRPSYKAGPRRGGPDASALTGTQTGTQTGTETATQTGRETATESGAAGSAGRRPDVISASKADPGDGTRPAAPGAADQRDNVLSFPEPKARRRKRILLATVGVLVALVAGIVAAAVYSPVLALRSVTVEGTKMLSAEQVQAALAPLQGKPLPQISEDDVAALLQPLVQVKGVSTQARPPSVLQVHITERIPVALVKQGAGFQLVDVDGVQLGTTTDAGSVSLPVINGGDGALSTDLFRAITAVLGALPADVLARLSDASAKSVDAVELKLTDGQTIVWGNAGEKELKAKVLAALLKAPADPKNPVRVYDVSVPRHPVTR